MSINHPFDPECTVESIQADVNAAKQTYGSNQFSFTWVTVQALLNKINDLNEELNLVLSHSDNIIKQ